MRFAPRVPAFAAALIVLFLSLFVPSRADVVGSVRGHVLVDGAPREGVTITLRGEQFTTRATSDAHGHFAFARVPFGRYALDAHLDGRPNAKTTIEVATDTIVDVTLEIGGPREIARTAATNRGVGGTPVSENVLGRATIDALPQQQSLNRLIQTVPGIVPFSYNEPVAHGFHGVTYEIDGAPLPQATSSNFSEPLDPRTVDALEVFTGAYPAEFGGTRMGAVVNIVTKRDATVPRGARGTFSLGGGSYGTGVAGLTEEIGAGAVRLSLNANLQANARGLDAPTPSATHDDANIADQFLRALVQLGKNDRLAIDLSNQYNAFQIPINLASGPYNPIVNVPGQDDVQREYGSFANVSYTHLSRDGNGFLSLIPWWRYNRVVYAGDLSSDVLALDYNPSDCAPASAPCTLAGLSQDRQAHYAGLRSSFFRSSAHHAFKTGVDFQVENFTSTEQIVSASAAPFFDDVAKRGTALGAYVQDRWSPSSTLSLQLGLRYDRSTGFVDANALQPRLGANIRLGRDTIAHAYYGRLYAAPALEDTRRDAVVAPGGSPSALGVYDLKPETDSYYELGVAHTFAGGLHGYLNAWRRNAWNVLDTTQIFPTPIFAVFNNAYGVAKGIELRLDQQTAQASWYLSGTLSKSVAGGISGATFLFPPDAISQTTLQPEDHDQAVTLDASYTRRFGAGLRTFATLGTEYGTGYPVAFENGTGRLLPHLTFDLAIGRTPAQGGLGFTLTALNLTNYRYLIKVENGFNTTQWAPGAKILLQLVAAY